LPGELDPDCQPHVCDQGGEKNSRLAMSIALTITAEIDQVAEGDTIKLAA
jgi:hypothetical protein